MTPPKNPPPSLEELYKKAEADTGADKKALIWKYRLARSRGRLTVAEAEHHRLVAHEIGGVKMEKLSEQMHNVYQELSDAAGSLAFCQEMVKS